MSKLSLSPERNTFQKSSYVEKLIENPDDDSSKSMLNYYEEWNIEELNRMHDPEWQKNNMEYDLLSTEWILEKVRASDTYAQNLYAAMCNRSFQKLDVIPILKSETWSCSWRHAGGIIADMQQKGDYINWYCSGIGDGLGNGDMDSTKGYVSESCVTDEIKQDLERLGWVVLPEDSDEEQ
jgi:hypothetical protein